MKDIPWMLTVIMNVAYGLTMVAVYSYAVIIVFGWQFFIITRVLGIVLLVVFHRVNETES